MRAITTLVLLTSLVQSMPAAQHRSDRAILDRAAAALARVEPSWRYAGAVCTCPPLMDEEEGVSVGTWTRKGARRGRDVASVRVHQIASADAASRWIANFGAGRHPDGWTAASYDLGDEAYLSTHRDEASSSITFRKGRFLVTVTGPSAPELDRVARFLLRQIEDS